MVLGYPVYRWVPVDPVRLELPGVLGSLGFRKYLEHLPVRQDQEVPQVPVALGILDFLADPLVQVYR